jgi:hypothetical protein
VPIVLPGELYKIIIKLIRAVKYFSGTKSALETPAALRLCVIFLKPRIPCEEVMVWASLD